MRNFWSAITLFSLCLAFISICFYFMSTTLWSFSYTTLIVVALLFVLIIHTLLKEYKQLSHFKKVVAFSEEVNIQWLTDEIVVINEYELNLKNGETFGYKIKTR